jgi:hypothetical protein
VLESVDPARVEAAVNCMALLIGHSCREPIL